MQINPGARSALRIIWVLLVMIVIAGSLLPESSATMRLLNRFHVPDKLLHFAGYALVAMLPAIHERWAAIAATALGLVALGVAIEFAQFSSGWGRMFELRDIAANVFGVAVGISAGLVLRV